MVTALTGMIRSSHWQMRVLGTRARHCLPAARVGAGALCDLVWGQR
jgi:hypothetical protein